MFFKINTLFSNIFTTKIYLFSHMIKFACSLGGGTHHNTAAQWFCSALPTSTKLQIFNIFSSRENNLFLTFKRKYSIEYTTHAWKRWDFSLKRFLCLRVGFFEYILERTRTCLVRNSRNFNVYLLEWTTRVFLGFCASFFLKDFFLEICGDGTARKPGYVLLFWG